LDHLGLSLAIKEYCETLAARHEELAVTVTSKSVPRQVRKDVALCLYRIVQEALGNIVAHSGATKARVELLGRAEEITLSIEDDGRGFDPEAAETKGRLGLLSMRERSRIVGGTITIRSRPAAGTRIDVRVPIANSS
jgi:signal transduction histidine kinase